jgi:hypothetical protein
MLDDVIGISSPVILIRPNLNRDLKTKSSKRVIEWGELCLPAERTLVMDYVRQIRLSADTSEFHRHSDLLFPDLEHSFLRISERKLFNPIERVMREVTGDQSLRFHHLRHSAINAYFLAMQEDLVPGTMALLLDQNADQPNMKAWRQTLVGKGESIRPRLWAIAGLAGHATPETTLGSYFHLCDWLRYQYAEAQIKLDDKLIAGLAGITIESLRVIRHREGSESAMLSALIRKRFPSEIYNWQPEACYQPLAEYHEWALQTPAFVDQVDVPWHKGTVQELKVLNEAADLVWPRALVDFAPRFPNSEEDDRKPNKVRSRQFLPEALAIADLSLLARRFGVDPFALKQKLRYVEQLNTQAGLSPLLQSKNQEATPKLAVEVGALQIQRRISLPSVILRRDDEDHATTFDQLLKQLYLEDPEQLDQFIDIFWRCIDLESSIINVGVINDALVLHNALHKLEKLSFSSVSFLRNGTRPRIRYQLRTVPNSHLGDADAQWRYWIELLSIQAEHLTFGEEMKKTLKGKECGVLQIYIELMPSMTKSGLAKRQSKSDVTEMRQKERSQALIASVYIATLQQLLAINVKPSDM